MAEDPISGFIQVLGPAPVPVVKRPAHEQPTPGYTRHVHEPPVPWEMDKIIAQCHENPRRLFAAQTILAAFMADALRKNAEWEASRKAYRLKHPHRTKQSIKEDTSLTLAEQRALDGQ